jgi:hypothetical protein
MSADIIQFRPKSTCKTVRPVFPSISGSLTIKSMDDIPLTGCAYGLIMGQAVTAPSECPPTDNGAA